MIHRNVHVLMCVVGIQGHQHSIETIGMAANLLDDLGVDRESLNQLHLEAERMLVKRFAVMGTDIDVYADHFAGGLPRIQAFDQIQKAEQGCRKSERSSPRDTCFNN